MSKSKSKSSKSKKQTVLEAVQELQTKLKRIEAELLAAKRAPVGSDEREKHMQTLIVGLCYIEDITHGLSEWWKQEHFKREWASGFCYECQGDGIYVTYTNGTKVKCKACKGKGRVAPRKPRGEMIPSGWPGSAEDKANIGRK